MSYVALAPVGTIENDILDVAAACVWVLFGLDSRRIPAEAEPDYAWDPRRRQYASVPILQRLATARPRDAVRLLAITEKDLFIPMLTFVFGQAQLSGPVALVSLARLRQEFYGLPPNPVVLLSRLAKECAHEMGHTFGLVHCPDRSCAMALSTGVQQIDRKGSDFCSACAPLVRAGVGSVRQAARAAALESMR